MPIIANTSSANTFSAVRAQLNSVTKRLNQFAVNESEIYANTITANTSLRISGTLLANSSAGTSGHYLRTSGTGVYWSPVSGGGGGGSSTITLTSDPNSSTVAKVTATANGTSYSTGNFSTFGDAIVKTYILRGTTTNATETELLISGSARIPVRTDTTVFYTVEIAARRTNATGESAAFTLKGAADNFSGTTADIGSLYEVIVARDDANYSVDVRASDSTDTINIYVTGVSAKTIRWVAYVTTVEVGQ